VIPLRIKAPLRLLRIPLGVQLVAGLAVLTLFVSLGAGLIVRNSERSYLTSLMTAESENKFQLLLFASIDDIISEDVPRIETTMTEVERKDAALAALRITNGDGHTIYQWRRGHERMRPLSFKQAVMLAGERFGTFSAEWDIAGFEHNIRRHALTVAVSVGFICILLSVFIFLLIHRMTVVPVNRIVRRLDDFRRGIFDTVMKLPVVTPAELRRLDQTVNQFGELLAVQEQREIEREAARQAAIAANRTKSEFLANMSHELRTPLNGILGFSEIMKMKLFGPVGDTRYAGYADNIHQSATHLLALINDILDISRIEHGKLVLDEQEVDLDRVIRASLLILQERARANGHRIIENRPAELPPVLADERKLKQILLNLLSNAIKFTPTGGRITLSVAIDPAAGVVFEVADSGIGIPREQLAKALEPFGQVDSTLARRYEGSGLGLPLAKALVELHGGAFQLESEVGVGTSVRFSLPSQRIVAPKDEAGTATVIRFVPAGDDASAPSQRPNETAAQILALRRPRVG
jgi:signal transduction histidine kinase